MDHFQFDEDDVPLPPAALISRPNSHPISSPLFPHDSAGQYHLTTLYHEPTNEAGQSRLREIISDQASEISRLKKVNAKLTDDIQKKIAYMQNELHDKNMEIISERDEIQKQLDTINREHLAKYKELQRERDETEQRYQHCISQLRNELEKLATDSETAVTQLERDMKVKQSEVKSLSTQLAHLRRLLTEMDESGGWESMYSSLMTKQNQLTNTIKDLETQLKAAQELTDIDLECKVKVEQEKPLDAWRRAVLKLLIQRESQNITFKKCIAEKDEAISGIKNELNNAYIEIAAFKDKTVILNTQINLERKRSKDLKDRKQQSDTKVAQLTSQLENQESSLKGLIAKCTALMSRMSLSEGDMAESFARLRQMEHRVESLTSRLPLIRAQWSRAAAKNRDRQELHSEDLTTHEAANKTKEQLIELEENLAFCRNELEKARNDRNRLIYQLEEENKSFQARVDKAKEAVADEVHTLRSTVKSLESRLQQVEDQLYDREDELTRLHRDKEELDLSQSETINRLEESLRKAKRDYAEAMLSLRQVERQYESEKETNKEKICKLEDSHHTIVSQLQREIDKLQAECNMMRTSLRQEGLLAVHTTHTNTNKFSNQFDTGYERPLTNNPSSHQAYPSNDNSDDTNLSVVIQEVTDLTQALSESDEELQQL